MLEESHDWGLVDRHRRAEDGPRLRIVLLGIHLRHLHHRRMPPCVAIWQFDRTSRALCTPIVHENADTCGRTHRFGKSATNNSSAAISDICGSFVFWTHSELSAASAQPPRSLR
jgi:hypothetical protein